MTLKLLIFLRIMIFRTIIPESGTRYRYSDIRLIIWNPLTWIWILLNIIAIPFVCLFTEGTIQSHYRSIIKTENYTVSLKKEIYE